MRNSSRWLAAVVTATFFVAGCGPDQKEKEQLNQGYAYLEGHDYEQALNGAEDYLKRTPAGAGSAEALYLKGRALEQRAYANPSEAKQNWRTARDAYADALALHPAAKLETFLHTSLGNVNYFLDDYATAQTEWTIARGRLSDDSVKAWVTYRLGLCAQRLGDFSKADELFADVQQEYPNTTPASRSHEKMGARNFSLQLATFSTGAVADNAVGALRQEGVVASRRGDAHGLSVVFVGPLPSYQQALALKTRFAGQYPDSVIIP